MSSLGHVDVRMIAGASLPVLYVHTANEVREGRLLRSRHHELEALFVHEHMKFEFLLQGDVE